MQQQSSPLPEVFPLTADKKHKLMPPYLKCMATQKSDKHIEHYRKKLNFKNKCNKKVQQS